jgi:hypothetical protein
MGSRGLILGLNGLKKVMSDETRGAKVCAVTCKTDHWRVPPSLKLRRTGGKPVILRGELMGFEDVLTWTYYLNMVQFDVNLRLLIHIFV